MTSTLPEEPAMEGLENNSSAADANATSLDSFYFYKVEQLTFLCIMFAVIVCANSLLLISLVSAKSRKSRTNFFIMHLALADLLVGLISVVTDVVGKFTVVWYGGAIACKIVKYFQVLVTFSSTYVLVALSIDRCDAIIHPMRFIGSWRRARMLVVGAWTVSALFASPMLVLFDTTWFAEHQMTQCWIDLGEPNSFEWQLYMVLISVVLFIIPAVIIICCYSVILCTLWSKGRMLKMTTDLENHRFARATNTAAGKRAEDCDLRRASSRGLIPKAKIKTVKMTFVIVFVFILCWSPYFVFDLLQVFGHLPRTQTTIAVATFIQSLAPLNSAANPIIYIIFSNNVCRNLRRLSAVEWLVKRLPCCRRWAPSRPSVTTSTFRYGTDFTTMSDSRSRSAHTQTRSIVQRGDGLRNYGAATSGPHTETHLQPDGATTQTVPERTALSGSVRV
ncbi:Cardioacceleratory peptide receptor [Amphibalanus amphitrite]|uniref:Cardioacceleratory peptide receptor n=1 Tax=Amphibalanus amphitrite TaxID=1232801 RepID=A0A6A4X6E0_AMPAM|nr:Cardioacceleratory peptide receptor [Amphibalanus amphitrite]